MRHRLVIAPGDGPAALPPQGRCQRRPRVDAPTDGLPAQRFFFDAAVASVYFPGSHRDQLARDRAEHLANRTSRTRLLPRDFG